MYKIENDMTCEKKINDMKHKIPEIEKKKR